MPARPACLPAIQISLLRHSERSEESIFPPFVSGGMGDMKMASLPSDRNDPVDISTSTALVSRAVQLFKVKLL
jgi:hypothetical protein